MENESNSGRVVINISGVIYETRLTTLARYPNTLLGSSEKRKQYYDSNSKQYFFNRNRQGFEAILYYYQSQGRLSKPPDMPFDVFKKEVEFFQLGEEVLDKLFRKEGYVFDEPRRLPENQFQKQVWECLEYPDTSKMANILTVTSLTIIIASVVLTITMTVNNNTSNSRNTPENSLNFNSTFPHDSQVSEDYTWYGNKRVWYTVELIINCLFAFEYVLRLGFSPDKWKFAKSPLNIVDLLAFLPYMVILALPGGSVDVSTVSAFHILRIVRIFRIFKISRYSRRLKVIGYCLLESVRDLGLFMICLVIITILASSLLYYIEGEEKDSPFNSIPSTFWFIIQTISTIGYGDQIPLSPLGKLATCAVAVFGVITLALPVLSFVAHFNTLYCQNIT
jgi:hypothetical protein